MKLFNDILRKASDLADKAVDASAKVIETGKEKLAETDFNEKVASAKAKFDASEFGAKTNSTLEQGKKKVEEMKLEKEMDKAKLALGGLVYVMHKTQEKNEDLLAQYIKEIESIEEKLDALKAVDEVNVSADEFAKAAEELATEVAEEVAEASEEVAETADIDFPDKLIKVRFLHSNETEMCVYPADFDLKDRDYAVVDGKYGRDLAQVKGCAYLVSERGKPKHVRELARIIRKKSMPKEATAAVI